MKKPNNNAVGIDADQAAKFAAAVRAIMRCEQDEFSLESEDVRMRNGALLAARGY